MRCPAVMAALPHRPARDPRGRLLASGAGSVKPGDPRLARIGPYNHRPRSRWRPPHRWRGLPASAPHPGRRHGGRGRATGQGDGRHRARGWWHGQPFQPPCVLLSGGENTVAARHRSWRAQRKIPAGAGAWRWRSGRRARAGRKTPMASMAPRRSPADFSPDTLARAWAAGVCRANLTTPTTAVMLSGAR